MTIKMKSESDYIELAVVGRIDSNTSEELQVSLLEEIEKTNHLVVDFSEVTYISSAGLRALLMGQKTATSQGKKMEISNVSKMVMEVLETVGFDKILSFK